MLLTYQGVDQSVKRSYATGEIVPSGQYELTVRKRFEVNEYPKIYHILNGIHANIAAASDQKEDE